jgi:uncharacterized integral membrane protein
MTDPPPPGATSTPPPQSAGGTSPRLPAAPPPAAAGRARTPISGMRTGRIAGPAPLTLVMIFIIQNARAVNISFPGPRPRLPPAVALLPAAIAGALIMTAAGTARITRLRTTTRRDRRNPPAR